MKFLAFVLFFFSFSFCFSQELEFIDDFPLDADKLIAVDNFENYYFLKNNTLYKKTTKQTYTYTNMQLGKITSVDITNPLKILLFYKDFNTVLFLDSQLNKLSISINFTTTFSKNIAFVNRASITNLWLYSFDDNRLQSLDFQTQKIQFSTQTLSHFIDNFIPVKQLSTYKNCWLIGENSILQFNEYGSFIEKYPIDNPVEIKVYKKGFIYLKENKVYYQSGSKRKELLLKGKTTIKNFSINTDKIYFFDGSKVFIYKLI